MSEARELSEADPRIRIGFLSTYDARDRRPLSGTPYYMAKALEKHCGEIHYLGPIRTPSFEFVGRALGVLTRRLMGRRYRYQSSALLSRHYGQIAKQRIEAEDLDVIFAPMAAEVVAFLESDVPIVYASDTTFALMHDYYGRFSNLLPTSIRGGNRIERLAIERASVAVYSSEWAATSARNDYGADAGKLRELPYGANLDYVPELEIGPRPDTCRLLFLGADWERKGGEIAFDTLLALRDQGVDAEMVVCGCEPPKRFRHPRLEIIRFLNKNDPVTRQAFVDLLASSAFLLLPTRGDCTPIVFSEASAFGLPAISTDTGGVSAVVREGVNGSLLPFEAGADAYAERIRALYEDREAYERLARSSRAEFEERLNWDAWALEVGNSMRDALREAGRAEAAERVVAAQLSSARATSA